MKREPCFLIHALSYDVIYASVNERKMKYFTSQKKKTKKKNNWKCCKIEEIYRQENKYENDIIFKLFPV